MAKHIAMIQRSPDGFEIRQKLIELEKEVQTVEQRKSVLLLAIYDGGASAIEATRQLVEIESEPYRQQIAEQEPLVEFAETVSKSCDNIQMKDMAKIMCHENINIGRNRLFDLLKEKKVLDGERTPYQSYIDRGYFFVKETTSRTPYGDIKLNKTTLVTPKGQIWLVGKVREWLETA